MAINHREFLGIHREPLGIQREFLGFILCTHLKQATIACSTKALQYLEPRTLGNAKLASGISKRLYYGTFSFLSFKAFLREPYVSQPLFSSLRHVYRNLGTLASEKLPYYNKAQCIILLSIRHLAGSVLPLHTNFVAIWPLASNGIYARRLYATGENKMGMENA